MTRLATFGGDHDIRGKSSRLTGEPEPYRIGLVRRFRVWRLGRQDGRLGAPDPLSEQPPLTTQARKDLELDFIDAARGLWVQYLTSTEDLRRDLRVLKDSELPALEAAATTVAHELERTQANPPDRAAPLRHAGETHQPVELIRDRRDRQHERVVAKVRQRQKDADHEVAAARQRRAALEAELAVRWAHGKARVGRLHATFQRTRAIYDHALLRRHPLQELVRPVLDTTIPPLPEWPGDPADGSER